MNQWVMWPLIRHILFREGFLYNWYSKRLDTKTSTANKLNKITASLQAAWDLCCIFCAFNFSKKEVVFFDYAKPIKTEDGKLIDPLYGFVPDEVNNCKGAIHLYNHEECDYNNSIFISSKKIKNIVRIMCKYIKLNNKLLQKKASEVACLLNKARINNLDDRAAKIIYKHILRFESERILAKLFLKFSNIKVLVFYYGLGKLSYIAAAKELGIATIEIQHGIFGKDDPGYKWNEESLRYKKSLIVPDKILVFGKHWQDILCNDGFWSRQEVIATGSSLMDMFISNLDKNIQEKTNALNIVFPTQWIVREESIKFFMEFFKLLSERKAAGVNVQIKLHPAETEYLDTYRKMQEIYPDYCDLITSNKSSLSYIYQSDLTVGYFSTCLLESLGLGVPVVSICGEYAGGGFSGYYKIDDIESIMTHLHTPEQLLEFVLTYKDSLDFRSELQEKTKKYGEDIYQPGFLGNATMAINRVIASNRSL